MSKNIVIWADGAAKPNPGTGGWAAILIFGETKKEIYGGFAYTTSVRMEMYAAIAALEKLKEPCSVLIYTDSQFLCDAWNKNWVVSWERNGWLTKDRTPVKNRDLWERMRSLGENHRIVFSWVRGHSGYPLNERCDELAQAAARRRDWPPDTGYADK